MTEKQLQTCYVLVETPDWDEEFALYKVYSSNYVIPALNELPDRYIFTKEELESYVNAKQREVAVSFLDSIRMYEHESGNTIYYDERSSEELFDIYLIHPKP